MPKGPKGEKRPDVNARAVMIGKITTGEICDTTRNSPMPAFIAPQIPVLSREPPTGGGWIHEVKHKRWLGSTRQRRHEA